MSGDLQGMLEKLVTQPAAGSLIKIERVKLMLETLERVPAARKLVLYRLTAFFTEICSRDLLEGRDYKSKQAKEALNTVSSFLINLANNGGVLWAQILSPWVIQTIERIIMQVKKYDSFPPMENIPAILNFYLQLAPMKALIDVYMKALNVMISNKLETSTDSLLNAPPPLFDWLIADVGNTFPDTIVERVFFSGFSKFCQVKWGPSDPSSSGKFKCNEKDQHMVLSSIIQILKNLNFPHQHEVTRVTFNMFKNPPSSNKGRIKVFLYLIGLFSQQSNVFYATGLMLLKHISVEDVNELFKEFQCLGGSLQEIKLVQKTVVNLICMTNQDSYKFFKLLVDTTSGLYPQLDLPLQKLVREIVPDFLKELQRLSLDLNLKPPPRGGAAGLRNGVFEGLLKHHNEIITTLITSECAEKREWMENVVTFMCMCNNDDAKVIFADMMRKISTAEHVIIFLSIYNNVCQLYPNLLKSIVDEYFKLLPKQKNDEALSMLDIMLQLMSLQSNQQFVERLQGAMMMQFDELLTIVGRDSSSVELSHVALTILHRCMVAPQQQQSLRIGTRMLSLTHKLTAYFFRLLRKDYRNGDEEMQMCHQLIITSAHVTNSFEILCQYLLDSAFTQNNGVLFGGRVEVKLNNDVSDTSLLDEMEGKRRWLAGENCYSSSTLIAVEMERMGVKRVKKCPVSKERQRSNSECLSLLMTRCCCKWSGAGEERVSRLTIPSSSHAYDGEKLATLASSLIRALASASPQLATCVSLDTSNQLEWPLPHLRKHTVERDLRVFHFMDEYPFVWNLLWLLNFNREALWKISPLLRSTLAVLITHFETCPQDSMPDRSSSHYICAMQLVTLISKGKLVPEPISNVGELLHHINNYDIHLILLMLYTFMRDNLVALVKKNRSEAQINVAGYMEVVHSVLHRNIKSLYHLCARFYRVDNQTCLQQQQKP